MLESHRIPGQLGEWLDEFAVALNGWEDWLASVEEAYVTGQFEQLNGLQSESASIQNRLAAARDSRSQLITAAQEGGFTGTSVTALVRWLGISSPREHASQLLQLDHQLKRAQQMSTALWVTGFQAASYTSAILDLLATGNANPATYGTSERQALEGGHIVDAAA